MRFDGKVALVSGAGSGIGRATAMGFAARGQGGGGGSSMPARRRGGGRRDRQRRRRALAITADTGTPAGIDAMVGGTVRAFGGLDILHNNAFGQPALPAGKSRLAFTGDLDERVWTHTIELGLTGVFRATKRAIPELLARGGGAIVNTASISGLFADYAIAAYNTAKAGVINLTRVTAIEYAGRGIRVNCVCPGAIDTPLLRPSLVHPRLRGGHRADDSDAAARPAGGDGQRGAVPGLGPGLLRHRRRVRGRRRPHRADRHADAHPATDMRASIRGTRIYFDVEGMGLVPDGPVMRARPAAMVIHGGPGSDHTGFKPGFWPLAARLQLIYFDHRGQGRSDPADPATYTLDENVEDMEALRRHLGLGPIVSIGTSYGPLVAMAHAARHPEAVSHLVLIVTAAHGGFIPRAQALVRDRGTAEQQSVCGKLLGGRFSLTAEEMRHYYSVMGPMYARRHDDAAGRQAGCARPIRQRR